MNDAWSGLFDVAVVLSNDTDLAEPMRLVTKELKKPVGLFCPSRDGSAAPQLANLASFKRHIRETHLRGAQFPDPVLLADGRRIAKPIDW